MRVFAEARARAGKRPLVIIPGILGSELVNKETGEVAWPSAFRSTRDGLALPLSSDLASCHDNLVARKIVDIARFGPLAPEINVYKQLLDAIKDFGGYTEGDLNEPAEGGDRDTFYIYPYDWRRDNVETARDMVRRLQILKEKLHRPDLRFNIIAHSMGGLIARYAAKYGDSDLPPEGTAPSNTWSGAALINKIIMFGTPNEGSADAFATLVDGYSVTTGTHSRLHLLKKLSRDDVVSAPSLYQLLPHASMAHFLDGDLKPFPVDLYDPATWKRYGWSALTDPAYRDRYVHGRLRTDDPPGPAGSAEDVDAYLAVVLRRARGFQEALDARDDRDAPVSLLAFGGDCEETLESPIILHDSKTDRWITFISPHEFRSSDGRRVTRAEATKAMYAPGDGRVTRRSLLAEDLANAHRASSLFNTGLPIAYAVFACEIHGDLQNNKTLQDNALTAIVSEAMK